MIKQIFVFDAVVLFMSTQYFPWSFIEKIPVLKILTVVEFAWRFLIISSAATVILSMWGIKVFIENFEFLKSRTKAAGILAFIILTLVALSGYFKYFNNYILNTPDLYINNLNEELNGKIGGGDYIPLESDKSLIHTREFIYSTPGSLTAVDKGFTSEGRIMHLANNGVPGYVDIPVLYYPYLEVIDINTGSKLGIEPGENYRIRIPLPESFDADVLVYFRNPPAWYLAYVISLVSWGILAIRFYMKRKPITVNT